MVFNFSKFTSKPKKQPNIISLEEINNSFVDIKGYGGKYKIDISYGIQ